MISMIQQNDRVLTNAALRNSAGRVLSFVRDWCRRLGRDRHDRPDGCRRSLCLLAVRALAGLGARHADRQPVVPTGRAGGGRRSPGGREPAGASIRARGARGRSPGMAFLAWFAGDALWLYYENILGSAPFPSWADAGYLAFYPLLFLGLLTFPSSRRSGPADAQVLAGLADRPPRRRVWSSGTCCCAR